MTYNKLSSAKRFPKRKTKSSATPRSGKHKSVVAGRTFSNNFKRTPRIVMIIAVMFALLFGGVGVWKLTHSNADTTALTSRQCYNRGRVFSSYNVCQSWNCLSGAGSYVNTNVQFGYCTNANSTSVSASYCVNTLHREYNTGSGGCARRWNGTFGNRFTNAWQCYYDTWTYVMASPYDYCVKPTTTTTTSTGWVWPVPSTKHLGAYAWGESTPSGVHKGIDIGNYDGSSLGDSVVAAHAGRVSTNSYYSSSCGYMVIVKADGTNYWTGYQHLASRVVSEGQYVSAGQKIGTIGKYGATTCGSSGTFYHLHFSVEKGDWLSYYSSPLSNSINPCSVLAGC